MELINEVLENKQIEDLTIYDDWNEPIYPIVKTEYFDEDNIKHLLSDTRINKQDRKRLTDYNKHRTSGGQVLVQYRLAKGADEFGLGRLFPTDALGLQSFRFDIRNPLTKKNYWDCDMENAHYNIAEKWCKKYDLPYKEINYYNQNRDACLKMVSENRKKAKTEFLKVLYGGNIKLHNNLYDEVEGDIKVEGNKFLHKIAEEVNKLMNKIWETHPQYHKLKIGGDKTPMHKKPNPKASLMSLLFQTDERKILMFLDFLMKTRHNRNVGILIHDGGEIERKDTGETEFPIEILEDCSKYASYKFNMRVKFTIKPIEYDWTPLNPKLTEYETRKMEFEKRNFFVGSQFIHIQPDGRVEFVKTSDMKTRELKNNYREYDEERDITITKYFFDEWLRDPSRATYERIDFIPDRELCPPYVFNLFKGFNVEKFKPEKNINLSDLEKHILLKPIIRHLNYLTSGHSNYLLKWLAKIIQDPLNKSQVAILLRDEGGFLTEGGGTGKNLFFEWFGNEIIGEDYFYVVGDNRELYGQFNSQFEGKIFVMVEEASSKENHSNNDILKSKITAKKQNVNKKCVAVYEIQDYTNYLFCSNNRNPLPFKKGNRRLSAYDTNTEMRGNENYFNALTECLNNPNIKWLFYQYLKNYNTYSSPIEFQVNIPITPVYIELSILNAPLHLKWIVNEVKEGKLKDDSVRELYIRFKNWVKNNKEGSEDTIMSETAFGLMLGKNNDAGEEKYYEKESRYNLAGLGMKKMSRVREFFWDIPRVVNQLKKIHLLTDDFKYQKSNEIENEEDELTDTTEINYY